MLSYTTLQNIISIARMVIDILFIAVLLYYFLKLIRNNSRTIQIFKGVLLIIIIRAIVTAFGLKTMTVVLDLIVQWGVLAIIIIFQPEIRSILERLGKSSVFNRISSLNGNEREKLVDEGTVLFVVIDLCCNIIRCPLAHLVIVFLVNGE